MLLNNIFVIIPVVEPDLKLLELVNSLKNTNSKIILVSLKDFVGKNEILLELQNYAIVLNCRRHSSYENAIYTALNYIHRLYDNNLTVLSLPVNGVTDFNEIKSLTEFYSNGEAQLIIKDSINYDAVPTDLSFISFIKHKYINLRYKADLSYINSCLCMYDGSLITFMIRKHQFSFIYCFKKGIKLLHIHGSKYVEYPAGTVTDR